MEAYRTIEKFFKQTGQELNAWSALALRECRMLLENELLEEERGFISTGLGGKGKRIRYCFVISSYNGESFQKRQNELFNNWSLWRSRGAVPEIPLLCD